MRFIDSGVALTQVSLALSVPGGNGNPKIAAMYIDDSYYGYARFFVKDSTSNQLISEGMTVQPSPPEPVRRALAMTGIRDSGSGAGPGLAILFGKHSGQGVSERSDAASGTRTDELFFVGKSWAVRDTTTRVPATRCSGSGCRGTEGYRYES